MNWLRRVWNWLAQATRLWQCLAGLLVALLFVSSFQFSELGFQVGAGLLQLFGVGTVALGIRQTRRQFGRPGVLAHARRWLMSFPSFQPPIIRGSVGTALESSYAIARGYGWKNAPDGASAEERIAALEENVRGLDGRLNQTEKELREQLDAQLVKLESEQVARAGADREISARLEATETGGLTLSLVGTVWIVVGIVLGTAPGELSRLLH